MSGTIAPQCSAYDLLSIEAFLGLVIEVREKTMKPHILVLVSIFSFCTLTCSPTPDVVVASDDRSPESEFIELPQAEDNEAGYVPLSWEIMTESWEGEISGTSFKTHACVYHSFRSDGFLVEWVYCQATFSYQGNSLLCPFLIVPLDDTSQVAIPIYEAGTPLECSDAMGGAPFLPPGPPPTAPRKRSQDSGFASF